MKKKLSVIFYLFFLVTAAFFSSETECSAEENSLPVPPPAMTTWMPENGQTHEIGYLSKSGGMDWIQTWTTEEDQAEGSMLRTAPITLDKGRYAVLFQVWHKEYDGKYLGELRAWSGDTLIASNPLISEEFPSYRDGGFQRAVLEVELPEVTSDLTFELYYAGNNNYIWTGAVNVSPHDTRRPFYNIGHRCSTIDKVNEMVGKNANAIEFDITPVVGDDGSIGFSVYHFGDLKYTPASEFDDFLRNLKGHLDRKNIALVELDCKQKSSIDPAQYARTLAEKLMEIGIPDELTVFSVPKAEAAVFKEVLKNEDATGEKLFDAGIDSYLTDYGDLTAEEWVTKVEAIGSTFIGLGVTSKIISPMPNWMSWIQAMTNKRDSNRSFKKAYFWTLNQKTSMRKCLDYGVDGVITNYPDRMDEVLDEEPYSLLFKRATQEDSQFKVFGFE